MQNSPETLKKIRAQRERRATPMTKTVHNSNRSVRKPKVAGHRMDSYNSPSYDRKKKKEEQFIVEPKIA